MSIRVHPQLERTQPAQVELRRRRTLPDLAAVYTENVKILNLPHKPHACTVGRWEETLQLNNFGLQGRNLRRCSGQLRDKLLGSVVFPLGVLEVGHSFFQQLHVEIFYSWIRPMGIEIPHVLLADRARGEGLRAYPPVHRGVLPGQR
eukprot:CAMPEP_0179324254 /NCGR_PEP_ID=MMETSP0797-20121207/60179_1 /TAXON_ID=47934 /ORGANISM="Dinophysis acuminata, Strain DAEP01" /LENGTH=146 /DNA_ID=CAMNT_0021036197 /DNA_START=357 /DNA_END=793 /DNA_ORIENTATION=+